MTDPFRELGLDRSATADDVRRARRRLAKHVHPDAGGQRSEMQALNAAAAAALVQIADGERAGARTEASDPTPPGAGNDHHGDPTDAATGWQRDWSGQRSDTPSFTVEALPVETFEALLLAAAELGEVEDDDPPYGLSVLLGEPLVSWCRLDVVPDAGASTVSVAIARAGAEPLPPIEAVRNAWVATLNGLDWSDL
jgi:hypothetical protein